MDKIKSRAYQRAWYKRQKEHGNIVYLLTLKDGNTYVGSTTNSLKKRLWQHRSCSWFQNYDLTDFRGEVLEEVSPWGNLKAKEQEWIEKLNPSINQVRAHGVKDTRKHCYKGGVWFRDVWYPTQYDLWKQMGKMKYQTFRTRLFYHPGDLEHALGLNKAKSPSLRNLP